MSEMVPKVRFQGFTDDWEQRKLGELADHRGGTAIEKYFEKDGKYKVISIGSYGLDSKYVDQNIRAVSNEVTDGRVVRAGELTMVLNDKTANGTIIGRTLLIEQDNEYVINQRTEIISPKENFNASFAYTLLNGPFRGKVKRIVQGGTQIYVNYPVVSNLDVEIPNIQEQQKIGSLFKHLDTLITLHQRKLDLLKEQKKGFLQKMFPKDGQLVPEVRFVGFADDWEELNLGDVTTWTKGQGLTKEDLNEERDGSEAVHYADLYKFSPVMHNVIHWTNSDDGRIIPDNSLLFPASDVTPVGLARASTLRLSGVKAGGDVIIGQLDESINSSFMSYQINANSKKILPLITGTTVKHVQAKSLATVSVSITNMAEQTAIAGIFERIDNLIALHQRKLDSLKEQKKGFLQKMFVSS